jgi:FSR family fosmidomycin resistance protein-like MFS transporter
MVSAFFTSTGVSPRRTLAVAGLAHALHDGFTDLIYVLLPVWQNEFAFGYGMLAVLRGLYAGSMAALQLPSGWLASRLGGRAVLALGTALAGLGYALAGLSGGLIGLCAGLMLSGAGSSTQHPIASAAVARAYGGLARGPLGTYNFTGDLGKAALPIMLSVLLGVLSWRQSLGLLALLGFAVAAVVALAMPPISIGAADAAPAQRPAHRQGRGGFALLFVIGVLDSGVRMGLLMFLPFLLGAKGASLPVIGTALALVFIGGAAGKFSCGWLGARIGVLKTVLLTEGATAGGILAVIFLPLAPCLLLLPLVGVALNGTSSVLYGTVPDLTPDDRTERAFALFYTGTVGSGALSPVLYGVLGDLVGPVWATVATAAAALATFPLALALAPHLPIGRPDV